MEFFDKRTQELLDCLLSPDESAPMDTQKVAVIDQLLEHVEVSVRTICDLIRFKCMKSAGMIQSMDEFLELYYDREQFIRCMEAWGGGRRQMGGGAQAHHLYHSGEYALPGQQTL